MNYEQKYNEVLQKAKEEYNRLGELENESMKRRFEIIFPELAESEDERIRTRLSEYFRGFLEGNEHCYKYGGYVKWEGLDVKSILDWLEKQKEQKPAEWSEKDEKILDSLIRLYSREYSAYAWPWANGAFTYGDVVNFLKSLRPSWKPSEEELVALKRVGSILRDYGHSELAKTVFIVEGKLANLSVINKSIWKPSEEQMEALRETIDGLGCKSPKDYGLLESLYKQLKAL